MTGYGKGEDTDMGKINECIEKNKPAWCAVSCFIIIVSVMFLVYLNSEGYEGNRFRFEEHLEDTALTVGEKNITLKQASYYIIVIESNLNEQAKAFDSENPLKYWNTPLNNGSRAGYLSEQAKVDTIEACIRDAIYFEEAKNANIELTKEELEECEKDAISQEKNLSAQAVSVTGYDYKDVYDAVYRTHILEKYMGILMSEGYTEEELDVEGEYYTNVRNMYDVSVNDGLWKEVVLGQITVNGD